MPIDKIQQEEKNQCDGCARNLPLEDGVHSGGGYDLIGCTKERYTPKTFTVATEEEKVEVTEHADGTIKANGIQIFSPHTNEEMRDFKEKLQEHLDLHFPKDGCKERGPALVLFAEAIYLANKQISDLKKSIREEKIICSAIKMSDGTIIKGHRHHDCIRTARSIPRIEELQVFEQGFIDSSNNFVSRETAWQIAEKSGQILKREDQKVGTLFSEDIY